MKGIWKLEIYRGESNINFSFNGVILSWLTILHFILFLYSKQFIYKAVGV